jgi:hypothetical protein
MLNTAGHNTAGNNYSQSMLSSTGHILSLSMFKMTMNNDSYSLMSCVLYNLLLALEKSNTNSNHTRWPKRTKRFHLPRPRHLLPILKPHQPRTQPLQPRQIPPPLHPPTLKSPHRIQSGSRLRIYLPPRQLPRVRRSSKTECKPTTPIFCYWAWPSPCIFWCSMGYCYGGGV